MFDKIYTNPETIKLHQRAKFKNKRVRYLRDLATKGYKGKTLKTKAHCLLNIIKFIDISNQRKITLNEIKKTADKWIKKTYKHSPAKTTLYVRRLQFILVAKSWLALLDQLVLPESPPRPGENYINPFRQYILNDRGPSEHSIYRICLLVEEFLVKAFELGDTLDTLTINTIDQIISLKRSTGCARNSLSTYANVIKRFLRYAEMQHWCQKGLANAIKTPRVYIQEKLPSSPSWNDVQRLLHTTEGNSNVNIRDRAILLLLAVYGLRRGEVVGLRLDDIDWKKEVIYINRNKSKKIQVFPLSPIIGAAIIKYLREVRIKCCYREIFLSTKAPYCPITLTRLSNLVKQRWKPLKVEIQHQGPHSLRHACATHLINEGVALKSISDYLGHQDLNTTRIYSRVNITSLRKVAELDLRDVL